MIASQFIFRFIRDVDDQTLDDILRLKKSRSGKSIVLSYKSIDLTRRHEMYFKDSGTLSEYLFKYLSLLKYDELPFVHIQFDPPAFPCILFTPENLHYNIRRIASMIEAHYNN